MRSTVNSATPKFHKKGKLQNSCMTLKVSNFNPVLITNRMRKIRKCWRKLAPRPSPLQQYPLTGCIYWVMEMCRMSPMHLTATNTGILTCSLKLASCNLKSKIAVTIHVLKISKLVLASHRFLLRYHLAWALAELLLLHPAIPHLTPLCPRSLAVTRGKVWLGTSGVLCNPY